MKGLGVIEGLLYLSLKTFPSPLTISGVFYHRWVCGARVDGTNPLDALSLDVSLGQP